MPGLETSPLRLAIVNLLPAPYREPLYQRLSQTPGVRLRVYYLQSRDSLRRWADIRPSYDALPLACHTPERLYPIPIVGLWNPGLIAELERFQPDCLIVHGYSYLPQMRAIRWAVSHRVPYLLWADSNQHQLRGGWLELLKAPLLRYFCRYAAGALTVGQSNEAFWSHYGLDGGRHFRSSLAVDNDFFRAQALRYRAHRPAERAALGLPPGRLLLYAGRFAPQKNLALLLRVLAGRQRRGRPPLLLALVGDGPEKPGLQQVLRREGLRGVYLFGFQSQSELARFYCTADALMLPSLVEPWGLVVNEAMACGLPVLVSRAAGCVADLLEEGGNGFSFDPRDPGSLDQCLERFSALDPAGLAAMGTCSAERIAGYSYDQTLEGLFQALESVRPGWRRPLPVSAAS